MCAAGHQNEQRRAEKHARKREHEYKHQRADANAIVQTQREEREPIGRSPTLDFPTPNQSRHEGENQSRDAERQQTERQGIDCKTTDFTEKLATVQTPYCAEGEAPGSTFGRRGEFAAREAGVGRSGGVNGRTAQHHEGVSGHSGRNKTIIVPQGGGGDLPTRGGGTQHVDFVRTHREDLPTGQPNGVAEGAIFGPCAQPLVERTDVLAPRVRKKKAVFTVEQDAIGRQRQRAAHRALVPVVEPIGRREIGARNIHTAQRFAVVEHKPREKKRNEKAGEKQSAPLVPATPTADAAHGADGRTGRRRHKQEMAPSGTARRLLIDEKGGVFDKDTHLSSRGAHAIRLFHQPKRALSRGSSMDSARRTKTDRKRRMKTRRVRRKTRGFRPKSSAFFRKVLRFYSLHGDRAIRKRV